jgi:hypothetical protein
MAVRVNLTDGVQQLGASSADVSLHNKTVRTAINAFNLRNTLATNVQVSIYDSPDATSAAGEKIAQLTLGPAGSLDETLDVVEAIGQAYAATIQIVAVVDTAGVLAGEVTGKITYTQYTGDS